MSIAKLIGRKMAVSILPFIFLFFVSAKADAQVMELGTNTLGWATLTPNLSIDFGFANHWSAGVSGAINPFSFKDGYSTKFWSVDPEFKWWPRHQFVGHAVGVHGLFGGYDFAVTNYRYKGYMYGCGVTYTYSWMFHKRWNLEGVVGVGYARLDHDNVYLRTDKYTCYGPRTKDLFGPTKLEIKVSYLLF